uniref:Serpin B6 n=1 Tax=Knipowitschia caucasica TaxID=637954 RepID=A0AAV2LD39_KNICA
MKVIHKAFVEVNEEGTEAAAATVEIKKCYVYPAATFIADHPFLFFIRHNATNSLEKQLTYEKFVEWTRPDVMQEKDTVVGFPRFKMEEKYNLKNALSPMMDAFDLSQSSFLDLCLNMKVIHKAFVEVNEEGTEAAAATVEIKKCNVYPAATFIADHPFLFFIRHNATNSVLFAGRYCSPE